MKSKEEVFKRQLVQEISRRLDENIEETRKGVVTMTESRDKDSKSTAGDKHDTTRAMAQIELEKVQRRLAEALSQRKNFSRIDTSTRFETARPGSLVETDRGWIFLNIGLGKVVFNDLSIMVISVASPLGKMILGTSSNEVIEFRGAQYLIKNVW